MKLKKRRSLACSVAAAALTWVGASHTQLPQQPQDRTNAIATYEVLGVRLGMPEAEAIAAVRSRFPAGTKNANGQVVTLRITGYQLTNPRTNAKVRAGVRIDLHPDVASNFDFVKIFVYAGKIWAVWRDDSAGRYSIVVGCEQARCADIFYVETCRTFCVG
ncbi:hypothetical protein AVHY2522_24220 [Acidovorax sp. SUPP2522]|uniref:hypothetical protein n=1 Tax=unclassified Acidovorax TaxID=2684926 RepID=UPI00234B0E94|nr:MULTISPECIES: hypothetical protein [unclassified Acidovorax]WCM96732.1 hypothetical protein M5C96_20260 [Acidovorax sp. GBBC 1281]GKT19914.1 hypothetical protein AVHY2522_24220 [Acidovorax sp. SUPP2522]